VVRAYSPIDSRYLRVKFSSDAGGCRDILIERFPTPPSLHHVSALSAAGLNSSAALGAAELLARELHGMFTERREVVTRDDVRQLTDAELRERTAQAVQAMGEAGFAARIRRMAQA
jgi:hypothetical protein